MMDGLQLLTFRELNAHANQVAHYLRSLGVDDRNTGGDLPAALARSDRQSVGHSQSRRGVCAARSGLSERTSGVYAQGFGRVDLAHQRELADRFPDHQAHVLYLDAEAEAITQHSIENPMVDVSLDAVAYVTYTSGSTGTPKGVQGLQRGAVNRFNWMWRVYPFQPGEVCCQKTYLSFVDSVWEIYGPLLQGVPIVIIPDPILKDDRLLIQTLADYQVTRIVLAPSLLRVLLAQ